MPRPSPLTLWFGSFDLFVEVAVLPEIERGALSGEDMIEVVAALRQWELDGTWARTGEGICNMRSIESQNAATMMEDAMMPVVRINDGTFADLSTLKTWYGTTTPSETIDRLVREAMGQLGMERDDEPDAVGEVSSDGAMQFETAPGLAFTKPLAASINGRALQGPRWSALLLEMIGQVKAKGLHGDKLVRELGVPAKAERYEEEGFKYHPELGISVQGQSAADVWKEVDRLAKKWQIPVKVEFWWRQNPKAQYPGRVGMLRSGGSAH